MTKKRILIFLLFMAAFSVSFFILMFDFFGERKPPRIYQVSVIVRGSNSDHWAGIRQGATQAANERNVDLSFITLSVPNSLAEQIFLLEREIAGGADAVIIAPADSDGMVLELASHTKHVPIVAIESVIASPSVVSYISADHFAMGEMLANEILARGYSNQRIAIADDGMLSNNVQERYAGLMQTLEAAGVETVSWKIPTDPVAAAEVLRVNLSDNQADVLVALDLSMLDAAAQAVVEDGGSYLDLFGIGSNARIASYIERDVVTTTIVQNDFAIGYLSVQASVDAINSRLHISSSLVEYRMINWGNMYDIENQRLLFPEIR